jgi:electron transfer flavoprotein beta subunit
MRCVLAFTWARNPEDARVGADGSVDWGTRLAPSDDDAAAAAVARGLGVEVVGLTLGGGDVAWAAARGAERTLAVTDARPGADGGATAAALAAGVRHAGDVDVVVVGDCAWDRTVPVSLGARLGWPTVAGVQSADVDGDHLRVTRRTAGGTEVLAVTTPAVLAVAARHTEQAPPGMRDVLAARKKPVERLTLQDLGVAASGVRVRGTALPQTAPARVFAGDDPAAAAGQLVAALRAEGVL